jgi:phospholipid transport system substrate-binding protein
LIELTSTKKLEIFKADQVEYREETIRGEEAEVETLVHKGRERVEVIYLLHRVKGEWKVYDMIIDELGLAENYRTQFNKIIQEKKIAGLLERLRERIQEEEAESGSE